MKHVLTLIPLLFSIQTYSKTLVISDIDDTIKVSHILSTSGKLSRAADVTTPFTGMAQLFRLILNQDFSQAKIVYLSNAPKEVAGIPALELSHRTFLSFNKFPVGEIDLRADIFDKNHKVTEIRRLINLERPDLLILVGDNGERDASIYHQIFLEYAHQIKITTFIHQLYALKAPFYKPDFLAEIGVDIYPEQIGFVTPIEIAVELNQKNLLDQKSLDWMIKNISPYIVKENRIKWDGLSSITFPSFKKCSQFKWKWDLTEELKPIYQKIASSCFQ